MPARWPRLAAALSAAPPDPCGSGRKRLSPWRVPPISFLATAFSLAVYFLAVWRGGAPERVGAAILFAAFMVDELYHALTGPAQFRHFDAVELAIDGFSLLAFAWLAVAANRLWPIVAAALQLMAVLGHLSTLLGSGMQRAYWAMTEPPVLLGVVTLAIALAAHWRRQRRIGPYPDWRPERRPA